MAVLLVKPPKYLTKYHASLHNIRPDNNLKMANNTISIKRINDLLKSNYLIPSYQRGYRWTEQQVTDLLNDINEFSSKEIANSDEKTWYCLQPIVVKKQRDEDRWEVIDGQQRLTTIFLIIHYINEMWKKGKEKIREFDLRFETRDKSQGFLKNILVEESTNEVSINEENIDYYFISKAYSIIHNWVKSKNDLDTENFESKFNFSTKVIWYEISKDKDSIDIFTRINSGKIPLTNAELIKALFLNSSNFGKIDSEKLRLKQLEIASEWDRMEYALQDDSFWYFINKEKNLLQTRIEFIFNLMADEDEDEASKPDDYSTFHFFNKKFKNHSEKELNKNWQEIKRHFQNLEECYNDRELYHKIGFLISTGISIKDILEEKNEQTKTHFREWIDTKIKEKVKIKVKDIDELKYGDGVIKNILLLHNIQTMLNNQNETNRFPFERYKKESWDVEHIHAIATMVKVKNENLKQWLENNFIKTEKHQGKELNAQIEKILNGNTTANDGDTNTIIDYVLGEEDNGLQNLCLLDSGTNRSYKNDSFKEKRKKIIEREKKGTFIPICTRNVFMKYYTKDVTGVEFWNEADRKDYFEELKEVIQQYLPKTAVATNE